MKQWFHFILRFIDWLYW